jgi:type II secretory pathway pseudopilin PulG
MKNNEKGFTLVLSLVLLLVMSLMGGALIIVASGDHESNNVSDQYQQTFYVAETALYEGERYLLNQFLGPWKNNPADGRDTGKRNLPENSTDIWDGKKTKELKNYDISKYDTENWCYNSFPDLHRVSFKIVVAESFNYGILLKDSSTPVSETDVLENYFYEYFITRIGSAPFRGYGGSVKKKATDTGADGMAYRVFGCGIFAGKKDVRTIIPLESVVVLPK